MSSLQQQLAKAAESRAAMQPLPQDMDGYLERNCSSLKDRNAILEEELRKSASAQEKLKEVNILFFFFFLPFFLFFVCIQSYC